MNYFNQQNIFTYVNGLQAAKSFPVMPGQQILLIDTENPYIYLRTVNQMGQPNMLIYSIEQKSESDLIKPNDVTRSELDKILERLNALENRHESTIQPDQQ